MFYITHCAFLRVCETMLRVWGQVACVRRILLVLVCKKGASSHDQCFFFMSAGYRLQCKREMENKERPLASCTLSLGFSAEHIHSKRSAFLCLGTRSMRDTSIFREVILLSETKRHFMWQHRVERLHKCTLPKLLTLFQAYTQCACIFFTTCRSSRSLECLKEITISIKGLFINSSQTRALTCDGIYWCTITTVQCLKPMTVFD